MAQSDTAKLVARPGKTFDVTVTKTLARESARKTIQRLFMSDPAFRAPIDARAARHSDRPKRRGGRIYVKHTRKIPVELPVGAAAKVPATTQHARDLMSVAPFVEVK